MPRPRTVSDEAVLEAAAGLIGRLGPAQLTFARLAEEVGLSAATLVQRFGSKRGLLLAVSAYFADGPIPHAFAAARAAHESPLDALVAALASLTEVTAEELANHTAFLQLDLSDPEFRGIAQRGMRAFRAAIEALLREAADAGELRDADPAALAQAVETTYNGALITWAIHREGSLDTWLRRQLEVLLGAHRVVAKT